MYFLFFFKETVYINISFFKGYIFSISVIDVLTAKRISISVFNSNRLSEPVFLTSEGLLLTARSVTHCTSSDPTIFSLTWSENIILNQLLGLMLGKLIPFIVLYISYSQRLLSEHSLCPSITMPSLTWCGLPEMPFGYLAGRYCSIHHTYRKLHQKITTSYRTTTFANETDLTVRRSQACLRQRYIIFYHPGIAELEVRWQKVLDADQNYGRPNAMPNFMNTSFI